MELNNKTLHLKMLKHLTLTFCLFVFWKQTLFLIFGDQNIHFSMENVAKPGNWLILPCHTEISKCTDSYLVSKESEFHGQRPLEKILALSFLYSSPALIKSQCGFLLFWQVYLSHTV